MVTRKITRQKNVHATPAAPEKPDIFALISRAKNIGQAAVAMQAMSHPVRIKIPVILSSGKQMVPTLTEPISTSQRNISRHLGILKACGIVGARKEATKTCYRIEDARIFNMITLTRDIFCAA